MTPAAEAVDLSNVWLFSGCSRPERKLIEHTAREVEFPLGTVILDEGEVGTAFYLIERGKVAVLRKGRKTAELGPGQIFGEIALLDRLPRTAACKALTDVTLLELKQRDFDKMLDKSPSITRKLLTAMATRLRDADARAVH
jgi:CRP-like cAMP-binding protein